MIMILANLVNSLLKKYNLARFVQGEHGLSMLFGTIAGLIAQKRFTESEIKDFLFGHAIFFQLVLFPIIVLEQIYTLKKSHIIIDYSPMIVMIALVPLTLQIGCISVMLYFILGVFDTYLECLIVSTLFTAIDGRSLDDKINDNSHVINSHTHAAMKSITVFNNYAVILACQILFPLLKQGDGV